MKKDFKPLRLVGIFWLSLGGVVLVSAIFPPTKIGKIVDLIAGGLLFFMGVFFVFLSLKSKE
jgi:predicted membrane channel-forming protein YqfA (hemolysin III family)